MQKDYRSIYQKHIGILIPDKMKKRATNINEVARKALQITRDEYALCSYVQYRQADRRGRVGWCVDTKDEISKFIGITRPGLYKMIDRLSKEGLLFSEPKSGALQVTELWIDTESECKQSLQSSVNKVDTKIHESVNLVTPIYKGDTKVRLEGEEINTSVSEKETFVTTFTPDQIESEKLAVTVVEDETFSLEAKKPNSKTSSAGPGEKENPALQNAGTFEASVPPNPPAKKPNGKPRKPPAQDRTAEICAELKTDAAVNFFHAIYADWGEWIDYKRREKKGTYKTAKTEAATIAALAKTVKYDPSAGRAAIEHSIAHTYAGIYPPKDTAPANITVERYSLEDHPVANTSEEMRAELSRFYNAHKDESLLDQVQCFAETNYGLERLRSIVTDFCGNLVAKGRQGQTFGQHHAALGLWLKRQKGFDAKNEGHQHAGSQSHPQLRSAAPVNYSID